MELLTHSSSSSKEHAAVLMSLHSGNTPLTGVLPELAHAACGHKAVWAKAGAGSSGG